eukprot:COSAG01_NODE_2_length_63927_cov_1357.611941_9_plen_176_part_00
MTSVDPSSVFFKKQEADSSAKSSENKLDFKRILQDSSPSFLKKEAGIWVKDVQDQSLFFFNVLSIEDRLDHALITINSHKFQSLSLIPSLCSLAEGIVYWLKDKKADKRYIFKFPSPEIYISFDANDSYALTLYVKDTALLAELLSEEQALLQCLLDTFNFKFKLDILSASEINF